MKFYPSKYLKMIFLIFVIIIAAIVILLVVFSITEYKPDESEVLKLEQSGVEKTINRPEISLMIWNIGYAGLGKDMDFFYDGGNMVRPDKNQFLLYQEGVLNFLKENDSIDFILLQEVDMNSKRSHFSNQSAKVSEVLRGHSSVFAKNYDSPFVPLPLAKPMGKVVSGVMSFASCSPYQSNRIAFRGNFSWPKSLFMLKRCFIVQRFSTNYGSDLVIINTHNSAFDDGELRQEQINTLKHYAEKEFENGNFVIVAGDWNMNPPGFNPQKISNGDMGVGNTLGNIPENFMPQPWQWVFDSATPTNRYLDKPYLKGETNTTIIDFFLISPNLNIEKIRTIDLGFEVSDHNPVIVNLEFIPTIEN